MPSTSHKADEYRWGYAAAGAVALGFAALIQFVFNDLRPDAIQNLPAAISGPYSVAGKLVLTAPIAVLGGALVLRDVFVNLRGRPVLVTRSQRKRTRPVAQPKDLDPTLKIPDTILESLDLIPNEELETGEPEAGELETGEPLAEEPEPTGPRIPAIRGRFSWLLRDDTFKPGARG